MASRKTIGPVLLVLVLLLLGAKATVQGAPMTPGHWLPGDDAIGPAAGDQKAPAISWGNGQYLAVWSDERADPLGIPYQEYETSSDIYAIRLDANGNPLDPLPFPVSQAPAAQANPKVSWNGENWLVVWEDTGLSGSGFYYSRYIRAARVSPAGVVLDSAPITVFAYGSSSGAMFDVASDGANWTVVAQGTSSGENDIVAVRISPLGVRLDGAPAIILPAAYYLRFDLRLAYTNGVYLLAWEDLNDIQGLRLDQNLQLLDSSPFTIVADNQGSVQLGANGTGFFAVWTAAPNFVVDVFGSRIDAGGAVLDPGGINISQNNSPVAYSYLPEVGWDGVNWRVTWGFGGLSIARVSPGAVVLDPGGVAVPVSDNGPTAVAPGGTIQMVWAATQGLLAQSSDVFAVSVAADFTAGPELILSAGAPSQTHIDLSGSGSGWMAVYRSAISGQQRILAQPLDASGNPIGPAPVLLDSGDSTSGPVAPKVAWNGSLYLVVWSNPGAGGIFGQRILSDGALVDTTPFLIMTGGSPDVSALGDNFLVAGTQQTIGPQFVHPFAIRVRGSDGALLDAAPFQLGQYFARWPVVVELGGRWLVIWQRNASHDDPTASTRGAFVNADGTYSAEFLVFGYYSTAGGNGIFEIGAAASNNVALVVQSSELTSGVETDLVGVMVNADGSLEPAFNLTPWQGNQFRPRVAWDGSQFIVAFNEQKNRFAPYTLDQLDARSDLFGMRINESGAILDPQGFVFSSSPLAETHPNVAAANGVSLLAGSILRNEAPYAAYRVGYDLLGMGGNAWPVAVAGASVTAGDVPLTVAFDSAGSTDFDGSIVSYAWDFGDGAASTAANPSHTYSTPGKYVVTLNVADDQGATSANTVAIQASAVNQPPVAVASANTTSGPAPLSVVVSASGSYDPDGSLGNIHWDFGDGSEYWGSPGYHTYSNPGNYLVTLTVWDNRGATGTDTLTITVGPANQPPQAVASAAPVSGVAPLAVAFTSAGSGDPDGTITSYTWTFGDGAVSSLANPDHIYTGAGAFVATLTVTDNNGATGSDSVTIVVNPPQMLVESIQVAIAGTGKWKEGEARVRIVDANNAPIGGATVTGDFSGSSSGSASAVTDANGEVILISPRARDGSYWQFCVTGVTKAGWAYAPATADCGDTAGGASNTLPTVSITNPPDGTTVSNAVTVQIAASDAEDAAGALTVEWKVDGGPWQPAGYNSATDRYESLWDTTGATNAAHALDARATDSAGASAADSINVTVDNGGAANSMYVGDLTGTSAVDGSGWRAFVTITILDQAGVPVSNATVSGSWNKGDAATSNCTTDAAGQCTVEQTGLSSRTRWVDFGVDDVTHTSLVYDPLLNVVSSVRISRP